MDRQQALTWLEAQPGEEAQFLVSLIAGLEDKALRYDLDQAGIESREREAQELVDLRARESRTKWILTRALRQLEEATAPRPGDPPDFLTPDIPLPWSRNDA